MFDWIPIEYYTAIYHHVLFVVAVLILLHAAVYNIQDRSSMLFFQILGYILLPSIILYIGLRQISGVFFGDTGNYAVTYAVFAKNPNVTIEKDYLFNYLQKWCAPFMDIQYFFTLIALLYIIPCYMFSRKYFGKYWFFAFFLFIGSFSFWPYGVNGIRNGVATSIFILALVFYDKKILCYTILLISYGFHNSLAIPIGAFIVSDLYKNPKFYLYFWLAAIPLSLIAGSQLQALFGNLFSSDDRSVNYLTKGNVNNDNFTSTGFRWDFVIYSASAVSAGYYYILKRKIKDNFYVHLFGTFVIANAFWILVIKANFSNRFAYLSWFLMAPVIIYPLLRYKIVNDQYKWLGIVSMVYYLFTYIMFLK